MSVPESGQFTLSRRPSRSAAATEVSYSKVVPSSLSSVAPILRIADEIEHERPRVAYLCRFYAFEIVKSCGRGEGLFKTSLLLRLERDHKSSLPSRIEKTDAREIESFYQQYYELYVRSLDHGDQADRARLGKAYQTAGVLFEVLCSVYKIQKVEEVPPEIIAAARDVQERLESYAPYNIFPLVSAGASKSIMQLEEIKAAIGVVVPSSLSSILPILYIANEIEHESPRVAYLCRFYAVEKVHRLDESSTGKGMRQFKASLLQRFERDNASSLASRVKETDTEEIESFYEKYYEQYIKAIDKGNHANRAQLGKAYQTAGVLFEVLCAVNKTENVEVEVIPAARDVQEKIGISALYDLLPPDSAGASQSIAKIEEVKAAIGTLLCNTRGLAWPIEFEQHRQQAGDLDILDWLRAMFGFQRDNVRNQREYLISILSNSHRRLSLKPGPLNKFDEQVVDDVMHNLFTNYKNWCACLGQKHSLWSARETTEKNSLHGPYLLIRVEAANFPCMPQCWCYIFHNMACELDVLLAGNVSIAEVEKIKSSYGCDDKAFLRKVITPIYHAVKKEARNYGDLNEYFWSTDCFSLGWPVRDDGFFSRGYWCWLSLIFASFRS